MDMKLMKEELKRDEGVRMKPYKDTVGKLTVGVGRNMDDVPFSMEEVEFLLANDINKVVSQLDDKLPWWRSLTEARQRVLVNMAFNLGINGLLGFKNTLKMVEQAHYADAAAAMLESKWARQVGVRASRLSTMMKNGV